MKCKKCKREIPENSVFCNWCGTKQIRDDSISVPKAKKLPSGSWRIQLMIDGVRHSITGETEKETKTKAEELKKKYAEIAKKPSVMQLGSAIDKYISERENVLSPSTIRSYKSYRKYRFKSLMGKRVCDISESDLQSAVNSEALETNPKTVKNAFALIASAADHVAGVQLKATLPRTKRQEHPFLEPEQIKPFLEKVKGDRCEAAILLGLHSLRISEIMAIGKDDIDIGKSIIHVNKAVVLGENGMVERNVNKTEQSTRDIPILIPRLSELLEHIPVEVSRYVVYHRIKEVCEEMGIKNIGCHGLRHTFASLCASDSVRMPQQECARLGGWSSTETAVLTDVYTHVTSSDRSKSHESIKKFFD